MKQGVLVPHRVRLLLSDGHSCYRARRTGERKRKSVRGCIVGPDIAVLSVVIVKQGEQEIPGLTDTVVPKRLGPKRATKIRRFFNLSKEDDVRKYVVRREVKSTKKENAKPYTKACVCYYVDAVVYSFSLQAQNPTIGHPTPPSAPSPPPFPQASPDRAPEGAEGRIRVRDWIWSSRSVLAVHTNSYFLRALLAKRLAERKEKAAHIKAAHKK